MNIQPVITLSTDEIQRDFSRAARLADEHGAVLLQKDGIPTSMLVEYSLTQEEQPAGDEEVLALSGMLAEQNQQAYEELAK